MKITKTEHFLLQDYASNVSVWFQGSNLFFWNLWEHSIVFVIGNGAIMTSGAEWIYLVKTAWDYNFAQCGCEVRGTTTDGKAKVIIVMI
jgi:hypothetical protein